MTLELKNITKRLGAETHIHPTSLTLEPGGFNVLLGATRAGKTSLIKLMAGLDRPTTGAILMNGIDVTGASPQKRNISLVHQFFVNYPHMTVFENIASPLRVAGVPKSEIAGRVEAAADVLRLRPMLQRRPDELSGGQQQRCALARAIVKESDLVLLDEPLANLDYKLREELRDQLPGLFAGRGAVVVYATSEPAEALMLGGRTATMFEGRVTQFGDTASVYRAPGDMATAEVFSDPPMNFAPVEKAGDAIRLGPVAWPAAGAASALADGRYMLGVRPHFVTPAGGGGVTLDGVVRVTELSGSESVAHFGVGDAVWVSQVAGVHPFKVGATHQFRFDPAACFYFGADGRRAV
ncbi:ABC transporter ATP-binding protein [Pikeienuella piscinae]|uniref:ABC transporter ATP-binding protein n=1 Tax=Pikeienuella piscinae TaxID=2748098 RepID=A0A7L5BSS0_9RHOB|nr:ABC transporter ATP-binding protein [Pikeienuella piscinae]QIE54690.1 ABC transporter ATP-binding protein [Pikeienuella piscinae]